MNLKKLSLVVMAALTFGATASFAVNVGDIVTFGRYPAERRPKVEDVPTGPAQWIVLKVEGDRTLLISKEELDCKKYNEQREEVTWETCTLRKWLNKDFINMAFTDDEQAKLCTVTLQNPKNPQYGTRGGSPTQDKVFCLNIQEAKELFPFDEARTCKPTPFAVARGAWVMPGEGATKGNGYWWLRSPGMNGSRAAIVHIDGSISRGGSNVYRDNVCVRPALWVSNL